MPPVALLDCRELGDGADGLVYELGGRVGIVEKGLEPDSQEGYFMRHVLDLQGGFEFLKLFRGHALGVEAVLAGVMIAGLASGLALGEHVGHFGEQLDADGAQDSVYAVA